MLLFPVLAKLYFEETVGNIGKTYREITSSVLQHEYFFGAFFTTSDSLSGSHPRDTCGLVFNSVDFCFIVCLLTCDQHIFSSTFQAYFG